MAAALLKPVVLHIKLGLLAPTVHFITLFHTVKGPSGDPLPDLITINKAFSFTLFFLSFQITHELVR